MNWIEKLATEDERFRKHGPEAWRTVKDAFRSVVESYNCIYERGNQPAAFNGCEMASENCFRVRMIPIPNATERYVELRFEPALRSILVRYFPKQLPQSPLSQVDFCQDLDLAVNGQKVTPEELSQMALTPLFFPAGVRPYPSNPPVEH